ncbi:MAG: hypothetical protein MUO76_09765, partial [Anaerolineaceae bacterium]|nr:hypothetical protein [Anaerolineaceae bacterium]
QRSDFRVLIVILCVTRTSMARHRRAILPTNRVCDPAILQWYHGLEYFDTWRWILVTGESFVHHTAESLEIGLKKWLDEASL